MRFGNALFQQLATGKKGAIVEPGDASLFVPAVLQPVIQIPGPFTSFVSPGATISQQSFHDNVSRQQAGASGGATVTSTVLFGVGLWRIRGNLVFFFSGTANQANISQFGLVDPDAVMATIWQSSQEGPTSYNMPFDLVYQLNRDSFKMQIQTGGTIAGDLLSVICNFYAAKLL